MARKPLDVQAQLIADMKGGAPRQPRRAKSELPAPLEKAAFYVASGAGERPCYLRKGKRDRWEVTADIACAEAFEGRAEAEDALVAHSDRQAASSHGPRSWRVVKAVTRTTFAEP